MTNNTSSVLRIDSFHVPLAAMSAFMKRVRLTHDVLKMQRGFIFDRLVEHEVDENTRRVITIVEWKDASDVTEATIAVKKAHASAGFNRDKFISENGILADMGLYQPVD